MFAAYRECGIDREHFRRTGREELLYSNRIEISIELQMLASARTTISFVNTYAVTPKNIRTITEFVCVGYVRIRVTNIFFSYRG